MSPRGDLAGVGSQKKKKKQPCEKGTEPSQVEKAGLPWRPQILGPVD